MDGSLRWDSTILQVPQQSLWSAVSVHLLVPKSSDLVLENTFNRSLAGLVAITAGCDTVSNYSAIIIGLIAGILVVFSVEFFDKVAKIDDPVGAISVHGVCGFTGSILVGVFSPEYTLKTQVIGVLSTVAYVLVMAIIVFTIIDKTVGLRVTKGEELDGLDFHEHGCSAYADFNFRL